MIEFFWWELEEPSFKRRRKGKQAEGQAPASSSKGIREELGLAAQKKPAAKAPLLNRKQCTLEKREASFSFRTQTRVDKNQGDHHLQRTLESLPYWNPCSWWNWSSQAYCWVHREETRKVQRNFAEIQRRLLQDHLTKQEAIDLRAELYESWA